MRTCPFCGFNEGWIKNYEDGFRVECNVCGASGPKSQTDEGAERKWDGYLQTKDPMEKKEWNRALKEELGDIFKSKTEKEITGNLLRFKDIIENSIYEFGEVRIAECDIVNEDPNDDSRTISREDYEQRFITPFGLTIVNWIPEGSTGNGWPIAFIKGPIEKLLAWAEIFYSGETNEDLEDFMLHIDKDIDENMGGVSAPMATLVNTPGTGNVVPASMAAMTGSQQSSSSALGSGDNWGKSMGPYTQDGKPKKKKAKKNKRVYKKNKKVSEQNISPFDEIGIMMAKKMDVPLYFEKGKDQSVKHIKQKQVDKVPRKYKHKISSYDDYANLEKNKKKLKT